MILCRQHLRFICSFTSALDACVMLELEARQVKAVSTSRLWTTPTLKAELTTGVERNPELLPPLLPLEEEDVENVSWTDLVSEIGIPSTSQCSLGEGRPERGDERGRDDYAQVSSFDFNSAIHMDEIK